MNKNTTTTKISEKVKAIAIVDDLNKVIDKIDELMAWHGMLCGNFVLKVNHLISIATIMLMKNQIANYTKLLIDADVESCFEL